jgi:hypothetical protein
LHLSVLLKTVACFSLVEVSSALSEPSRRKRPHHETRLPANFATAREWCLSHDADTRRRGLADATDPFWDVDQGTRTALSGERGGEAQRIRVVVMLAVRMVHPVFPACLRAAFEVA